MKKHYISPGDSLASIADCYNTDYQTIQTLNGLTGFTIYIGNYLLVPTNSNNNNENNDLPYCENEAEFPTATSQIDTQDSPMKGRNIPISVFTTTTPPAPNSYTVKAGDTLLRIATQFDTTPDVLKHINSLSGNNIFIGQILRLPTPTNNSNNATSNNSNLPETYIVKPGDTLNVLAWIFGISAENIKILNNLKNETLTPGQVLILRSNTAKNNVPTPDDKTTQNTPLETIYYTVAAGDTFYKIAQKFGIKIEDILTWNKLPSNAVLNLGQQLIVGKKSGQNSTPVSDNTTDKPNLSYNYYTVMAGDTFFKIAQKFGIRVEDILMWNKLPSNAVLSLGQQLMVGYKNNPSPQPKDDDNNHTTVDNQSETFTASNTPLQPNIKFAISDTVGTTGRNIGQDVALIQAQLVRAGFLSTKDGNTETPLSNNVKINAEMLPLTIAAIKAFQANIVGMISPTGLIRPEDATHQFLNTFILPPTAERFETIKEALKTIVIRINSGREELATPLSAPVGQTEIGNNAEDVKKVQIALTQLTMLSLTHGETPANNSSVSPSKLPRTLEAIKRFQRLRVENCRIPAMADSNYTAGVIGNNEKDLSFRILRDYIEYIVSFSHPTNPNSTVNISFRNFINSKYTVYTEGVTYKGEVMTNLPLKEYEDLGLNKLQAEALRFVSTHEGNFDAINSYDKATFSYGFIQFAGNNGSGGLASMLALMKINRPNTFKQCFQQYGIDVEYAIIKGEIGRANLIAIHPVNGKLLRKGEAEACIKNYKTLTAVFIRATYNTDVQRAQIEAAKRMFVVPTFNIEAGFKVRVIKTLGPDRQTYIATYVAIKADQYRLKDEYSILKNAGRIEEYSIDFSGQPLTDIIRSEKGLTALLDICVNKWTIEAQARFANAITQIAAEKSLDTKEKICAIDEKMVLTEIAKNFAGSQLKERIDNILTTTTLSLNK